MIDDIMQIVRMGSKASFFKDKYLTHKSVASAARDSVFQFGCLITKNVSMEMAVATTRLLDRNYASFVQIMLSQIANVDISIDPTPIHFLKRMHQNMKLESVSDDDRLIKERIYNGETVIALNESKNIGFIFEGCNDKSKIFNIKKVNASQLRPWLSDFDLQPFFEADMNDETGEITSAMIADARLKRNSNIMSDMGVRTRITSKGPTLTNQDVKKTNDLAPYAIEIRLNVINEKNEFVEYWNLVVGVKTILHLIDPDEIVENISKAIQNRNPIFRFVQWTTGEISLFKDLILHLDDIKFDERNRSKGYSSWFPTLKRMKNKKLSFRDFSVNRLVPNSTLVISSSEVDELERKYGILIKDTVMAKRLVDNLFLMAFVILDEGTQTMDIMYDHSNTFETYALETVQREVSLSSNKLANEIGRMISSR